MEIRISKELQSILFWMIQGSSVYYFKVCWMGGHFVFTNSIGFIETYFRRCEPLGFYGSLFKLLGIRFLCIVIVSVGPPNETNKTRRLFHSPPNRCEATQPNQQHHLTTHNSPAARCKADARVCVFIGVCVHEWKNEHWYAYVWCAELTHPKLLVLNRRVVVSRSRNQKAQGSPVAYRWGSELEGLA